MKKKIFLIFLLFQFFFLYSENIILDDVSSDAEGNFSVILHNISNPDSKNLKVVLAGKEYTNFTLERIKNNWLFGIIIDNSGSMKVNDFLTILNRVKFLLNNVEKEDYLVIWKVNDIRKEIYPLSFPVENLSGKISTLVREGNYTRLYDAIIQSKKDLIDLTNDPKYKDYFPYLLVFSDGDDIASINKSVDIYKDNNGIPFYFFSYITLKDQSIIDSYKKLSDLTKGKILERPTEENIKDLFIERENRFLLKFHADKKEVLKSKSYIAEIKINPDKSYLIDLKELFGIKKSFKNGAETTSTTTNNLTTNNSDNNNVITDNKENKVLSFLKRNLFFLLIILPLILLLIIFFIIRHLFMNAKYKNQSGNRTGKFSSGSNTELGGSASSSSSGNVIIDSSIQSQSKNDNKNNVTGKENNLNDSKNILSSIFYVNQKIVYRESRDLLTSKKFNKLSLFHNEDTDFVDNADNIGEEVYYNIFINVDKVEESALTCYTNKYFLLDEILKIKDKPYRIISIFYNSTKDSLKIKLVPLGKINLIKTFKKGEKINAAKKTIVFGNSNAIIENMLSKNPVHTLIARTSNWESAVVISCSDKNLGFTTQKPLILDTILELKSSFTSPRIISTCRVIGITEININSYEGKVELI